MIIVSVTEPVSPSVGTAWVDPSTPYALTNVYEFAVENGFVGTLQDFLDSLVGPQGPQGDQGIQGDTGEQGNAGIIVSATAPASPVEGMLWLDIA